MTQHHDGAPFDGPAHEGVPEAAGLADTAQVSLRSPAELADALPYLLGFHPDDSIVVVGLHGAHGRFGGRLRIGIPPSAEEWPFVAEQLAACLESGSAARCGGPDGALVFLCQDPGEGEDGAAVMSRLRPLAQFLRTACGAREMPVYEALCLSGGRYWSYCSPASDPPGEGSPMAPAGTSAMAAAAAVAGIRVRGSLREMEARLTPPRDESAARQSRALDRVAGDIAPRMLVAGGREVVRQRTIRLARGLIGRLRECQGGPGESCEATDKRDDGLISDEEAAAVILGLQDRATRDRAAEWMEGRDAAPALRLWRALARRCVARYKEHSAAPLTLAGWVAWSSGDEPAARVAFGMALTADPGYVFAQLLHQACNEGLDPEPLRRCMRAERAARRRSARRASRALRKGRSS